MDNSVQYTWTEEELDYLKGCAENVDVSEGSPWDSVRRKVNAMFHNCRTGRSCQRRYKRLMMRERTGYDKTAAQGKRNRGEKVNETTRHQN